MAGKKQIVKVRWVKNYQGETSHECIGEVIKETASYIVVKGLTFHFEKHSENPFPRRSQERVRWIPWHNIALITELPSDLNWRNIEFYVNDEGRLVYKDYTKSDETALPVTD